MAVWLKNQTQAARGKRYAQDVPEQHLKMLRWLPEAGAAYLQAEKRGGEGEVAEFGGLLNDIRRSRTYHSPRRRVQETTRGETPPDSSLGASHHQPAYSPRYVFHSELICLRSRDRMCFIAGSYDFIAEIVCGW